MVFVSLAQGSCPGVVNPRVECSVPDSVLLPPFQHAAGQDVFLYWNNNGCDPGRLRSPNQARK